MHKVDHLDYDSSLWHKVDHLDMVLKIISLHERIAVVAWSEQWQRRTLKTVPA